MNPDQKRLIKSYGDIAEAVIDEIRLSQTTELQDEFFAFLSPYASSQRIMPYFANSMHSPTIEFVWNGTNELRIVFYKPDGSLSQEFKYTRSAEVSHASAE